MRVVSPLLQRVVYPGLAAVGYFRAFTRPGLAIVTYHGILPDGSKRIDPGIDGSLITADTFRQQLRLLKTKYTVISPEEMLAWCRKESKLPTRAVLLTCDDGLLNNLDMLPVLQEEGLRCLFFVTGASAGDERRMLWYQELQLLVLRAREGAFEITADGIASQGLLKDRGQRRAQWWKMVKQLSKFDAARRESFLKAAHTHFGLERPFPCCRNHDPESERHFGLLTRGELQRLAATDMTIGVHTLSHPMLSQLPREAAWTEIVEGRARLEPAIEKSIWAFAYPFGDEGSVSAEVLALVKQAGFEAAFLNIDGGLGASLPQLALPRIHVTADMSLAEFEAHVSGFYGLLQRKMGRPQFHIGIRSACIS